VTEEENLNLVHLKEKEKLTSSKRLELCGSLLKFLKRNDNASVSNKDLSEN
jgi:hypothetical protein